MSMVIDFMIQILYSKIFVIISLKNMGMSLNNINQYVNNNDFDIRLIIKEEKRRIETAITDLQLHLMRLSSLDEQLAKNRI
ncbi:hypothetical protein [Paenibacillus pabuli]|uniref:hypothetical protein n=1 Tax=Paenibacillus pabuli TaxID=1472 RepID=UPI00143031E2|nr:hypothetical protein [Paenibacillus pabuli]MEC0128399.1 hypothetical protein [Paenibacillus pabuli]